MEPLLPVSIKSEATQLNLAQTAMKSINLGDASSVSGGKKKIGLLELSEDEVLLGKP